MVCPCPYDYVRAPTANNKGYVRYPNMIYRRDTDGELTTTYGRQSRMAYNHPST